MGRLRGASLDSLRISLMVVFLMVSAYGHPWASSWDLTAVDDCLHDCFDALAILCWDAFSDRSYRSPSGGLVLCSSIQYCKAHLSVVELNTPITLDEDMLLALIRGHGLPEPAIEPSTLCKV